jgi:hypothetical protein
MDNDIQKLAKDLLIWMLNQLEEEGNTIGNRYFEFGQNGEDRMQFCQLYSWDKEKMEKTLKYCCTHQYIGTIYLGSKFDHLKLTPTGFALAQSTKRINPIKKETQNIVNILGSITGQNIQVGNQNTQNIKMMIEDFEEKIDKTEASIEEKIKLKKSYTLFSQILLLLPSIQNFVKSQSLI